MFFRHVILICLQGDSKQSGQTLRGVRAHNKNSELHRNTRLQMSSYPFKTSCFLTDVGEALEKKMPSLTQLISLKKFLV